MAENRYDAEWAKSRLASLNVSARPEPVQLPVTARGVLFSVMHSYQQLSNLNVECWTDIYAYIRIALACLHVKLWAVKNCQSSWNKFREDRYAQIINWKPKLDLDLEHLVSSNRFILTPLKRVIDAFGTVKHEGKTYIPFQPRDEYTSEDRFIPRSENVSFNNLRKTVVALADERTDLEHRVQFYRNNPLAGAIWRGVPEDPILTNPNDFAPDELNYEILLDDFDGMRNRTNYVMRKMPKMINEDPWNFKHLGSKGLLLSNHQSGLRCKDRSQDQDLVNYYRQGHLEGSIVEFWSIAHITKYDLAIGATVLAGELPVALNHRYPIFCARDERNGFGFCSGIPFRSMMSTLYSAY